MRGVLCALAFAVSAAPAVAQDRMTDAICQDSFGAALSLTPIAGVDVDIRADEDGWCRIDDATLPTGGFTRMTAKTVRWRGTDLERLIEDGLPPRAIELRVDGITQFYDSGDAVFDYLLTVQLSTASMSFALNYRWDGVQSALFIEDSFLELGGDNRVELNARIDGVDLTNMVAMQASGGTAGLRSLDLRSRFNGWFERYAVTQLGLMLLRDDGTDVPGQVAQLRRQAIEFANTLPDAVLPAPSRTHVAAFVNALPTPRGDVRLQISADPVIGAARTMPLALQEMTPASLEAALDGVVVTLSWTEERP